MHDRAPSLDLGMIGARLSPFSEDQWPLGGWRKEGPDCCAYLGACAKARLTAIRAGGGMGFFKMRDLSQISMKHLLPDLSYFSCYLIVTSTALSTVLLFSICTSFAFTKGEKVSRSCLDLPQGLSPYPLRSRQSYCSRWTISNGTWPTTSPPEVPSNKQLTNIRNGKNSKAKRVWTCGRSRNPLKKSKQR